MKKFKKVISLFIIILIIYSLTNNILAIDFLDLTNPFDAAKDFIDTGESHDGMTQEGINAQEKILSIFDITLQSRFNQLIDFVWGIGLLTIFVSTIVLGIKYMFTLPEEKSRIKQATSPYVVGVIIIFGALTIWKITITILESVL